MEPSVVVAILAKNKAVVLPFYLKCLLNQTFPKTHTHLYIRTNDNTDATVALLDQFVKDHRADYASVYYDNTSISDALKAFKNHEWNTTRFSILGKIRQDSVEYAKTKGAHYFVADCDNFIVPSTLDKLVEQAPLGVVAPMLVTKTAYSNFHYDVDANGYLKDHPHYLRLLNRQLTGCVDVKVVHCTYFVANHILPHVRYDDGSARYEYVVFSNVLRKASIPQYLDNRQYYGFLTFADTEADFKSDRLAHATAIHTLFEPKKTPIYCWWTGTNPMSASRTARFEQLKKTCAPHIVFVTNQSLPTYILADHPLHAGFPYLSETHKADYLKAYFMHFYGGGYSDIKATTAPWTTAFAVLQEKDAWACGYPEVPHGVSDKNPTLQDKWPELIGTGAYICKPRTPLTTEWYNELLSIMDAKLEDVKANPAKNPQDKTGPGSLYPFSWSELGGDIFHRMCYKYKDKLLNTLPISVFTDYR